MPAAPHTMPSCPVKFMGGCLQKGLLAVVFATSSKYGVLTQGELLLPACLTAHFCCLHRGLVISSMQGDQGKQIDPYCMTIVSCTSEPACRGLFCPACRRGCHHLQVWHCRRVVAIPA